MTDRHDPLEATRRIERDANQQGRDAWALYAGHRERVTQTLIKHAAVAGGASRLCLLGAGNCNDVDLPRLFTRFGRVHLVDIDTDATARAVARLPVGERGRVTRSGSVDLTGLIAGLGPPRGFPTTMREVEARIAPAVAALKAAIGGPFDAVASCCVMTQLQTALNRVVKTDHPMGASIGHAAMLIHLRLLAETVSPGRPILIFNDAISNHQVDLDLSPEQSTDAALAELLQQLAAGGRGFEPSNPILIGRLQRRDPVLAQQLEENQRIGHWLWDAANDVRFLVYAMVLTRRPT